MSTYTYDMYAAMHGNSWSEHLDGGLALLQP